MNRKINGGVKANYPNGILTNILIFNRNGGLKNST
jgi:hypothetical protein